MILNEKNQLKSIVFIYMYRETYEPHHEKTCFSHMRTTSADQPAHSRSLISVFVVRCQDRMIPLVSISKISSLYLPSVAAQAGLFLTWSQTPKTGFLVTRLILNVHTTAIVVILVNASTGNKDTMRAKALSMGHGGKDLCKGNKSVLGGSQSWMAS